MFGASRLGYSFIEVTKDDGSTGMPESMRFEYRHRVKLLLIKSHELRFLMR